MSEGREKREAARKKFLGDIGEELAMNVLEEQGFENIRNLNDEQNNKPFADIYAEKSGKSFVISVKARNKCGRKGKENPAYNLVYGKRSYEKARQIENEYKAVAHWMAIPVDKMTYSVYFGSLRELGKSKDISMRKCKKGKIGQCFFMNGEHGYKYEDFGNTF